MKDALLHVQPLVLQVEKNPEKYLQVEKNPEKYLK